MKICTHGLALAALVASSGCNIITVCNGTGETIIADAPDFITTVAPCECNEVVAVGTGLPGDFELEIFDLAGNLVVRTDDRIEFDKFVTFDGFEVIQSDVAPDFSSKSTIVFRNNASESVNMRPAGSLELKTGPHTLVSPAGFRVLVTNRTGTADFAAVSHAACSAEIVDGLEIVWDGQNLTCGVLPPPPPPPVEAEIELCNLDPFEFALPVFMFIKDEETANLETQMSRDDCRTVTVPTGIPVTFVVRDIEDVVQMGECTLDDPGAGDLVVWTGWTCCASRRKPPPRPHWSRSRIRSPSRSRILLRNSPLRESIWGMT